MKGRRDGEGGEMGERAREKERKEILKSKENREVRYYQEVVPQKKKQGKDQ